LPTTGSNPDSKHASLKHWGKYLSGSVAVAAGGFPSFFFSFFSWSFSCCCCGGGGGLGYCHLGFDNFSFSIALLVLL